MSPHSKLLRAAVMLALAVGPRLAEAQKALVYCPVSIDATGCAAIKTALTGAYPGGIDTGFDGTQGTVDLKTVDLFQYSVVVVPSLADDSTAPYALLRDATVASKLKAALLGRRAFWSGTPDQGVVSTTRPQKDALIQNLAAWAGADFATVNAPGLVVLQDNSTDLTKRYDWVQGITGFALAADTRLASYSAVSSLTAAGNAVLTSNGSTLSYANMASMGFQTPSGASGTSMDAVGQTGTGIGGQVVLITQSGANTGGALITTDKDDYAPGTPVVMTGSGFGAGETVTLVLHEDPTIEPDFSFTATADQNGGFVFSGFSPDSLDVDIRFVLKVTGQSSGRVAQTTFTDAQPQTLTLTPGTATVAPGGSTPYTVAVGMGGNASACTVTLSVSFAAPAPVGVTATFSGGANPFSATNTDFSRTLALQTTNSGAPANRTQPGSYGFTVQAARGANCQGNGNLTTTGTLVVAGTFTPTLTLAAPSPASVVFGSSGPVSLSATLSSTNGPVSGSTVTFSIDGSALATTATTDASGVATIANYNPSSLGVAGHTVSASSAQVVSGGNTYVAATSGNQTLTVTQANQTIAFGAITTKTFGDPAITLSASATSGLPVSYAATGNCTVATNTVTITGAGSCTITASQAGNTNFAPATPVQQTFTINKGSATLAFDAASLSATYDGTPHAATVTTTPAGLTTVAITYAGGTTVPINAGSYALVATLTNANYSAPNATGTLNIARATPTFSNLSAPTVTYKTTTATISGTLKAGTQPVTGTVTIAVSGTGGSINASATLDASGNFTKDVDPSVLPASPTPYDVAVSTQQSTNFEGATGKTTLTVNKATQLITFGALAAKTFGDAPFAVSATSSSGLTVAFSASGACTVSGSSVTITGAGNCTVTADQIGDGNYDAAPSVPQSFAIGQATANVTVNGFSGTYDGQAHGATGTATGVGGADLQASLNLGQSFTNVPGGTASWTFTGGQNYKDAAGTAAITITPAAGSVSITGPSTITYGQSGSISTSKVGDGTVAYAATTGAGTVCTVDPSNGTVTMISGTGDCTVVATLSAGTNYTGAVSTGLTIAAAKATATVNVNGYTGIYDGQPHGATGTATGLNNANLSALLNLGASFTDVPGGVANWSFAGDANYASAVGTAQITLTKANQSTAVVLDAPATMTFGQSAVTLTATGGDGTGAFQFSIGNSQGCSLAGDKLSVVNASASCAVTALRLGDNNHFDSSPTAASTVALVKANANVVVNGFTGTYDGLAHGATGTATGVLNEDLVSGLSLGATFTNYPGGSATWTFTGGNNYNSTGGSAAIVINQRAASVTPNPAGKVYGQLDPPLTGSLSNFVANDGITASYTRATGENVAGSPYTISAQLSPSGALGNYNVTYNTAAFTITPATPTVSVQGGTYPYDTQDHPATGAVAGVNGEVPGQPAFTYSRNGGGFSAAEPRNAGTWTVKANFAGGGNYTAAAEQTATITITPKTITPAITASGKTYDGTTAVVGAVSCSLTGVFGADASTTGCTASGASFDDPNAGPRTVTATTALTGTTADNYLLSPTTASVAATISPAPTTTVVSVSGATYDAQPHGGSAQVTGAGGLSQAVAVSYSGSGYGPSATPPTAAGSYTATASYPVGGNYLGSQDSKPFTIAQRPITISPSAPDLIWTGSPLTPNYSIGVTGGSLAGSEQLNVFGSPSYSPLSVTAVGIYPITLTGLTNANYALTIGAGSVRVLDTTSPTGSITSLNPVALGVAPTLVVNFNDVPTGNSNIVAWKLTLDGIDQGTFAQGGGPNATFTRTLAAYSKTDVVSVCVSGEDAGQNWSAPVCALLAIYDPSAGFVTGGGWIDSPAGAYTADLTLKGKANFGFVSKYQKGANVPSGNTEFQFKEGNLNFSSTSFQWLVIQGTTMSQFKGTGTINGQGSYNFLVTAIDGDQFAGTKKPDSFRIKITNGSTVVYDNQMNADDTSASATVLGGGSIQIQSK